MKRYFVGHYKFDGFWRVYLGKRNSSMYRKVLGIFLSRGLARQWAAYLNRQDNEARGIGLYKEILKAAKRLPDLPI